jgi:Protein of unknown function (DUF4230)
VFKTSVWNESQNQFFCAYFPKTMTQLLRTILRTVLLGLVVFGIISVWEIYRTGRWLPSWFDEQAETTHTIVLQEIQSLGKLELVRYNFKDVVEHELARTWLPNPKAILIVQGEAVGCLDLTKMTLSDIQSERDTLVVHLPEPELCSYKIDHTQSKVYNTEFAFTEEALLVDGAYQQAEVQIKQSALDMGILDQTKRNAEQILKPLLKKIAGREVALRYRMKGKIVRK